MPNNISYKIDGKGEIILFLHGWGQNKEMMEPLIEELKNKYKCVTLDLPGFGQTNFNDSKNVSDYVELLRKFLKNKNLLPKYIVGHSFGGKLAIEYYLKYKDLKKIIIIASPILRPTRNIKYYYKIYKYKLLKKLNIKTKLGSKDYLNCPNNMKSFFVNVVNTHYDDKVEQILIPTLLIWGDKDKQVPVNKAKKLNKLIKNCSLYITKGEHFAYLENIEFTRLAIQNFLRGTNK